MVSGPPVVSQLGLAAVLQSDFVRHSLQTPLIHKLLLLRLAVAHSVHSVSELHGTQARSTQTAFVLLVQSGVLLQAPESAVQQPESALQINPRPKLSQIAGLFTQLLGLSLVKPPKKLANASLEPSSF
jgi:hypothetical protein